MFPERKVAMRILIAEDDKALGLFLTRGWRLKGTGFAWLATGSRRWRRSGRICRI
jgi:hypothetical protein